MICRRAWNEYFSVMNIELYDGEFLQVEVVTVFPEEFGSKLWQP